MTNGSPQTFFRVASPFELSFATATASSKDGFPTFFYINHIAGAKKKGKILVGGFNPLSQILIKLEYFPK